MKKKKALKVLNSIKKVSLWLFIFFGIICMLGFIGGLEHDRIEFIDGIIVICAIGAAVVLCLGFAGAFKTYEEEDESDK